jgi:hypothetical protein
VSESTSQTTFIPGKNGGRLRNGGTNKGGPGRPKDEVRAACALAFDQRIVRLKKIADGKIEGAGVDQQLKAIDMLAKYAGLQKIEHEHSRKPYREAVDEVRKGLRLVG